jgi:hypothetical protein
MSHRRSVVLVGVVLLGSSALVGCRGKVLGTAELHAAGTAEAQLVMPAGKLALWADTAGKWRDAERMPVHYEIDVLAAGKSLGHVTCDTSSSKSSVCGLSVTNGNETSADCELKLACELPPLPATGTVILRVTAKVGPNVQEITKVSLNVRAG